MNFSLQDFFTEMTTLQQKYQQIMSMGGGAASMFMMNELGAINGKIMSTFLRTF